MRDNNIYYKNDKGRYTPIGVLCPKDYLYDGIWYVKHTDHSRSITSAQHLPNVFRIGDSEFIDLPHICGMEDLCSEIMQSDEFKELINGKEGYSINDIIHVCVKKIVDKYK